MPTHERASPLRAGAVYAESCKVLDIIAAGHLESDQSRELRGRGGTLPGAATCYFAIDGNQVPVFPI